MSRRLPPVSSLIAFEAAARHLSFKKAAQELNITQSAISQRIQALEAHFGLPLFHRLARRVDLTPEGRELAPRPRTLLDQLEDLCDRSGGLASSTLTVCADASFCSKWLMPRIGAFSERWPDLKLQIVTTTDPAIVAASDPDVFLSWGRSDDWPGMQVARFIPTPMFPVCHPSLCAGEHRLASPHDLQSLIVMRHITRNFWPLWLEAAGAPDLQLHYGMEYSGAATAIEAAAQNQGVCLTSLPLVEGDIRQGRLARPFETLLWTDYSFYFVCHASRGRRPAVQHFRRWLEELGTGSGEPPHRLPDA